jgi:hypothetical protein
VENSVSKEPQTVASTKLEDQEHSVASRIKNTNATVARFIGKGAQSVASAKQFHTTDSKETQSVASDHYVFPQSLNSFAVSKDDQSFSSSHAKDRYATLHASPSELSVNGVSSMRQKAAIVEATIADEAATDDNISSHTEPVDEPASPYYTPAHLVTTTRSLHRNQSPRTRADPPALQGHTIRRLNAVDPDDSRSAPGRLRSPRSRDPDVEENKNRTAIEALPELLPKASVVVSPKEAPTDSPGEPPKDSVEGSAEGFHMEPAYSPGQLPKDLSSNETPKELLDESSNQSTKESPPASPTGKFDRIGSIREIRLSNSFKGRDAPPLGIDTGAPVHHSVMHLPSPGMTEASFPKPFSSPGAASGLYTTLSNDRTSPAVPMAARRDTSAPRSRPSPEDFRPRSSSRQRGDSNSYSNGADGSRDQPPSSASTKSTPLPSLPRKQMPRNMVPGKFRGHSRSPSMSSRAEVIVVGGPSDKQQAKGSSRGSHAPSVQSASSVPSVGSASLDALLHRIEETKSQLEETPNTTNRLEQQARLKSLVENLAAAAAEVERQELDCQSVE